MPDSMQEFVARENIRRFEHQIESTTDERSGPCCWDCYKRKRPS